MKKRKSCFIWLLCILLLVTALPSVNFTDVQAASVSSTFTGWKTFGGKKYFFSYRSFCHNRMSPFDIRQSELMKCFVRVSIS